MISFIIFAVFSISACRQEPPPPVERIRAIKTFKVKEIASGQVRKFSGVVEATDKSSISFEVSGNVKEVRVDVGHKVAKGQVLATLDTRTFKLNVEAAEADLGRFKAELENKRKDFERMQRIAKEDPGAVSQAAIDQAEAAFKSEGKNLEYANSQLNLAKRDLTKTVLRAPYDCVIADRYVDPFNEVKRGQRLFDVYIEGAMEAAISIPESEIEGISLGLTGEIRFSAEPGKLYKGSVSKVSSVAGKANAFPVKVAIQGDLQQIRPGLTVEVTFKLSGDAGESTYQVPLIAVVPGSDPTNGYVFVYDNSTSTVKKTSVSGKGGVRKNNFMVTTGVKAGDIIAAAGVSFLEDGQKVKLME
jgi:RND family efflux transporter MFP subunit